MGGFNELGDDIRKMPHITIPAPGDKKLNDKPNDSLFNEKEQKTMKNIKKWVLVAGVITVVGYGAYKILKGWLF